jgi:hypothetical protein
MNATLQCATTGRASAAAGPVPCLQQVRDERKESAERERRRKERHVAELPKPHTAHDCTEAARATAAAAVIPEQQRPGAVLRSAAAKRET